VSARNSGEIRDDSYSTLLPTPLSLNPEKPMLEYDTSSHHFWEDFIGGAISTGTGRCRYRRDLASVSR
jgi:hypothetical protein